ncbi:MAG: cold shock domain-containing protein, partial [Cytophagales bacterium]|nr:cold shock domain-containing protein [Cytophagales bacterium]
MATFSKKEKEKKRLKKREEKKKKKEERKNNSQGGDLDSMIAWVDEFGNIVDEKPDPEQKKTIKAKDIEVSVSRKEDEEIPAERKGHVDFFNDQKGFGFIKEQETKERFFFHVNGLIDDVVEGNLVTFEVEMGLKG